MKSKSLQHTYSRWANDPANGTRVDFVDEVYAMCEEHYDAGGDTIVECYGPDDILAEFKTPADVRRFCGLHVEQALNARLGSDDDPELTTAQKFDEWNAEKL
jgi:hypothetical protein